MTIIEQIENKGKEKAKQKYEVLLKFLNKLIEKKYNKLTNILDFKNIKRDDLIIEDSMIIFEDSKDEIFKVFDKNSLMYTRKNHIKTYIISIIKIMTDDLGLKFTSMYKNKKFEDTKIFEIYYSIELK